MLETLVNDIIPQNDEQRLEALRRFEILYTTAEETFDNITQMMAEVFNVPMAFISLVDKENVFYKSQVGPFGRDAVRREHSLCSLAVLGSEPLIIEDASEEACFRNNPYVAAQGGIRFYAGAPLITKEGYHIGTVCLVDIKPRPFFENEKQLLLRFAKMAMHEIEVRHAALFQIQTAQEIAKKNEALHTLSQQLRLDKERFDLVAKATQDAIWDWNLLTNLIWWNDGFKELFGYSQKEIEPTIESWYSRVHPEDRDRVVNGIHEVINQGGKNWLAEYRFLRKDGSHAIVFDRGYALYDSGGKPYRMVGSMQDITGRKQAEKALIESQEELKQFKFLADHAQDPFILMRQDGTFSYLNQKALEAWGYGKDETKQIRLSDVDPVYDDKAFAQLFARAQNEAIPQFEMLHKRQDGYIYPVEINVNGITLDGKPHMFAVARDITERKKTEEALVQSEARTRLAVESANLGTFEINVDEQTIIHSPRAAEIIGFDPSRQWPYSTFKNALHPEDAVLRRKAHEEAKQSGKLFYEVRIVLPDKSIRWLRVNGSLVQQNSTAVIIGIMMDITEEKKAADLLEQKITERTMELKQANEQLKQFTYAASHDLQEPLRKISYFLERLLSGLEPNLNNDHKRIADRIQFTTERMRNLIDDLLNYSNTAMGVTKFAEVDLSDTVRGVLEDMEATIIEKRAGINHDNLPCVRGDQRQLRQLFQNLISNAVKYHKKGETPQVQITSRLIKGEDSEACLPQEKKSTAFYEIAVKDNGIGFDPDDAHRIFRLFQRLHGKAEYEGTGVGLAIVQKVVENHNGYVCAEGEPDKGATFKVLLPVE